MTDTTNSGPAIFAGPDFSAGDIVMLLRLGFYLGVGWRPFETVRMVAIVALLGLARTGVKPLLRMKRKHFRPGAKDVMVITSRNVRRVIPVTAPIRIAVERHMAQSLDKRPNAPLLQTATGSPLGPLYFGDSLPKLDRHLGLPRSIKAMLAKFALDALDAGDEEVFRYFKDGDPDVTTASAPIAELRHMMEDRDPFGGALPRALGNDHYALELARRLGTSLPDKLRTQASQKGQPKSPRLGTDHPFVAWLLTQQLPVSRFRVPAIEALLEPRKEEFLSLIESGVLPRVQATELLRLSLSGLATLLASLNMTMDEKEAQRAKEAARRRRPRRRRPRSTAEDRSFIAELLALGLARAGKERLPDVDRAIRAHFPKAAELLNRRILTTEEASELFGLKETQISALKMAFPTEVGLKTAKQRDRHRRHVEGCDIVLREWDGGDPDETNDDRHRRLMDRHGFQFGRKAMVLIKRYAVAKPPPIDGERSDAAAMAQAGPS
ncbi:hypothetical protein ACVWZ4_002883 [Bradyrhizobium sp. USDA 4472]